MHAALANVIDLSKMQILQQKVQPPHPGAPGLSSSAVLCRACRLVLPVPLLLDRSPGDFQYLLNIQWQYGLPRHTSVPQRIRPGGCACPGQGVAGLCSPRAATHTVPGMLPPQGQTPARERKGSLEAEEMPSVSRLNLSSCRGMLWCCLQERCLHGRC